MSAPMRVWLVQNRCVGTFTVLVNSFVKRTPIAFQVSGSRGFLSTSSLVFQKHTVRSDVRRELSGSNLEPLGDAEEFTPLEIKRRTDLQAKRPRRAAREYIAPVPPRYTRMPIDQNWGNVWPTARTYHPGTVPLPVRMGFRRKKHPQPSRFGNLELMKIPNFLHLTPPVIKQHCDAIRKFCSAWPENLETTAKMEQWFPLQVVTSDYVYSSPSIREPKSRIVTLSFSLARLDFSRRSQDKFVRLLGGDRYDRETGLVTLVCERCPIRQQNLEYGIYLMVVLYAEASKFESWEKEEKIRDDDEEYIWEGSPSEKFLFNLFQKIPLGVLPYLEKLPESASELREIEQVATYAKAVEDLNNVGENPNTLAAYKSATLKLLNLPEFQPTVQIGKSDVAVSVD